jgi:hypothetical protein
MAIISSAAAPGDVRVAWRPSAARPSPAALPPDLHRPLVGKQQPSQASAIGLIRVYLAAQSSDAMEALIPGFRQFHYPIRAEGGIGGTAAGLGPASGYRACRSWL